jgi:gas vesicle protein
MRLRDVKDMKDLRDMSNGDVADLLDELRAIAMKRGTELLQQGRLGARRALGAPDQGSMGIAFFVGVALGAAVGAIVALLMTPMPGREARQRLAHQAEQMRERMPEMHMPEMKIGHNGRQKYPGEVPDLADKARTEAMT